MNNKYLLEIGTEELPYKFIPQAIKQLEDGFKSFFETNKIEFGTIKVMATPRRLAIIVDNLSEQQPDEEKTIKGPIKKVAYDENGNLTQAGLGFLKKNGIDPKDAYVENDYLHAKVFTKGKDVKSLLQQNIPHIILKLQGSHFMRWAGFDEKFSRPIRWIVSLFNNTQLPIEIIDIKSSNITRGHRFSKTEVEINNVDEYENKLKDAHVIVDQNKRKDLIVELTQKKADEIGAKVFYTDDLLEEVTYICEYPVPVMCDFDEKYLQIPEKVTVTVMAVHQRYFALYKNEKLMNKFITIANFIGNDFSNIKAGNERVIVARLDDAIFFFNEDTKKSLESYVEHLKGVTFQKNMGSVYDKTQRIVELSKYIAPCDDTKNIERTALLCKADLTTSLVFEFTELQGFIGAAYAKKSGENDEVSNGIKEHYFPLNAESELAENIEGQIVGIADKIDTVCAVFIGGKIPTGSSDPLGVRRAALGVLKTIINKNLDINLDDAIKKAYELLPMKDEEKFGKIKEFFVQRLIILYADKYKKDVLEACAKNINPLINLCDYVERVELVSGMLEQKEYLPIVESANRINKLVKISTGEVNEGLFTQDEEKELYNEIKETFTSEQNYKELLSALLKINPVIEKYFEHVLVMDKDEKIKQNRMSMLLKLKEKYNMITDFAALQI